MLLSKKESSLKYVLLFNYECTLKYKRVPQRLYNKKYYPWSQNNEVVNDFSEFYLYFFYYKHAKITDMK